MGKSKTPRDVDHDLLEDHNARQAFEHQLIDRRLTWLLSSQAILFAAFGLALTEKTSFAREAEQFQSVVALAGLCTSLLTCVSVSASYVAKWSSWRKHRDAFAERTPEPDQDRLPWGVNTGVTIVAMLADVGLPVVLAVAWLRLW